MKENKVFQPEQIVEWKSVKGYEGLYEVSSLGWVRSIDRVCCDGRRIKGYMLKQVHDRLGYRRVNLCKNGKPRLTLVHRIVAEAFLPNPEALTEVNHKDECPQNNCVENLEWCDHRYNMVYGTAKERRLSKVRGMFINRKDLSKVVIQFDLKGNEVARYSSAMEAARQIGGNHSLISACCRNEQSTSKGYKWQYAK